MIILLFILIPQELFIPILQEWLSMVNILSTISFI
jgi:hypothetical protein